MKKFMIYCFTTLFVFSELTTSYAENPTEQPKEHLAEQPVEKEAVTVEKQEVTIAQLAEAIENYVKEDSNLKGGYFLVYDQKAKEPLVMTLSKVHKDKLTRVSENTYFACADFKTPEGKIYDLDFFMKGTKEDTLKLTEVSIHKEAGKPRYNWYQEAGIWKKKLSEEKPKLEHPVEHPK